MPFLFMHPTIIFENDDYLIINKPSGLVVHADGKTDEPTLSDWLIKKYPDIKNVGEPWTDPEGNIIYRPGIVHRLDRDTSGIMVIAKTQKMYESLKNQFQERLIEKTYHAFVEGEIKGTTLGKTIRIERPIGRSKSDFRRWSAQRGARGEMRDAITDFIVIEKKDGVSFIEARPKTGRTHQIRVHFKAINHPIVGDILYGAKAQNNLGFSRTALHSRVISFEDMSGEKVSYTAEYPADFQIALKNFD